MGNKMIGLFNQFAIRGVFLLDFFPALRLLILAIINYYVRASRIRGLICWLLSVLISEVKTLLVNKASFILKIVYMLLFVYIVYCNVVGLLRYTFTVTSLIWMTLALRLVGWIRGCIIGYLNNPRNNLLHITPVSTPPLLMSFMVLIEGVRNLIRPVTLRIRLAANLVSGHIILSLVSQQLVGRLLILPLLFILEMIVRIIQAYVFTILSVLYFEEYN